MLEIFAASALDGTHAKRLGEFLETLELFCRKPVIDPTVLVFFAIPVQRLPFRPVLQFLVKKVCYP